jgi:alkylation response protein AidB-like acyl-CoA dehydrogenase
MGSPLPASDSLLAGARAIRPLLEANAAANEAAGALCDEVVEALHDARIFAIFVPRSLGGQELTPTQGLEVLEEIAYADGSTGWVVMASCVSISTAAAFLGDDLVRRMFSGTRTPVIAGHGAPVGKAVARQGGYLLSGNWSYGSGVKHADYIHSGGMVVDENGIALRGPSGAPEPRIFVAPREHFEFQGNWDVMGLRATGSIDYKAAAFFVPEDATHPTECTTPRRGGPFFSLGIRGMSSICHAGFTLGVGRRILDEVAAVAKTKGGRFGLLRDSESFLEKLAAAEAKYRAARAFLFETWHGIEKTLYHGDPLSTRQATLHRLALNHLTWSTAEISSFAFFAGGGAALRESTLQRCFRDMHAAAQHATSAPAVLRDCGRELAGLAEGKVWGFSALQDPR